MKQRTITVRKTSSIKKSRILSIDGRSLTTHAIRAFINDPRARVTIDPAAVKRIGRSQALLTRETAIRPIYGVNTGFGPMVTHIISTSNLADLQYNLIRGHAVGMGEPIRESNVLSAMIVRLNTLARGHSGVSFALVEALCTLINHRITPIVPEHGAVGTSGDLVQLAHIGLMLIGEGDVMYGGKRQSAANLFKKLSIKPHKLEPKEGLSIINGTSMMSGVAALGILDAVRILNIAVRSGALALELIHAISDLLDPVLHETRPHAGQKEIARRLRALLKDSELLSDRTARSSSVEVKDTTHVTDVHLQDVYSFRCMPQILGAQLDTIERAHQTITIEINSTTDNPIIDVEGGRFLHGGNFHGEYIAMAVDQVKAALIKLTMLSERRINFFVNRAVNKTFSPFLNLKQPGLNMGLQGLQFVATSTTAQSQSLAFPHAIHSIPTNADNQDIVSMGCDAALIMEKVIENAYILLTIELTTLAQAVDATGVEAKLSAPSHALYKMVRTHMKAVVDDRTLTQDLEQLRQSIVQDEEFDSI